MTEPAVAVAAEQIADAQAIGMDPTLLLVDPEVRKAWSESPEQAIELAMLYVHQKQERLMHARRSLHELVGTYATAEGAPPVGKIPGGLAAQYRVTAADNMYRLALRDFARVVVLARIGPRPSTPSHND